MSATLTGRPPSLEAANVRRQQTAVVRRALRLDRGELARVLADPPECLHRLTLIDVVMLCLASRRTQPRAIALLGRMALRDGVNLLLPVGRASPATRQWLADRVSWTRNGRGLQLVVSDPVAGGEEGT